MSNARTYSRRNRPHGPRAGGAPRNGKKSLRRRATSTAPPRRYGGCRHTARHHPTAVMLNTRS
eukprot:1309017-Prymnesium_polylepis.1